MSSLYCYIGIPAILSVVCIAVGVFSPAWMIYSMRIDTQKLEAFSNTHSDNNVGSSSSNDYGTGVNVDTDIWMGLWTIRACYRTFGFEACKTVSTAELLKTLSSQRATTKAGNQKLIGDWLALQILAVCSLLCVGFGLTFIYIMRKATEDRKRSYGLMTAAGWLLTAIVILAAVGKQATDYGTYNLGSDVVNELDAGVSIEFHTPWAIIVSGIGGAWAAVVAVITVLFLIVRKQQPSGNSFYTMVNKNGQLI